MHDLQETFLSVKLTACFSWVSGICQWCEKEHLVRLCTSEAIGVSGSRPEDADSKIHRVRFK